jgi:hypothetical protein
MDADQNFWPPWQVRLAFGAAIGFIVGMFGWMLVFIAFAKTTMALFYIFGAAKELQSKYQLYVFNVVIVIYFIFFVTIGIVLLKQYFLYGFLATLPLFIFISMLIHVTFQSEHMLAISGFVIIFMLLVAVRVQGKP